MVEERDLLEEYRKIRDKDKLSLLSFTDNILDYEIEGRTKELGKAAEISAKFNLFMLTSIIRTEGRYSVMFHVAEDQSSSREIKLFLESAGAKLVNGNWISTMDINQLSLTWRNAVTEFAKMKSTVLLLFYLERGVVRFKLRFHHSELKAISDLILKTKEEESDLEVEYLGKSRGILSIIKDLSEKIPLTRLNFCTAIPESSGMYPGPWIREVRNGSTYEQVDAVYYLENEIEDSATMKKISGHVYDGSSDEKIHSFFTQRSNELGVVRICRIQERTESEIVSEIILPTEHLSTYLSVLGEANEKFKGWNVRIMGISNIAEDLKNMDEIEE